MTRGVIGLHGGGELVPGDEPFLRAILAAAAEATAARLAACVPASVDGGRTAAVILPAAAGGERPDLAVAQARAALGRVAGELGMTVRIRVAEVVDRRTAEDPVAAAMIVGADLVYLPGGDPDRAAHALVASAAGRALLAAHARGAAIAGASAGAMALCGWTWTHGGGRPGLGLVPEITVAPHADRHADGALADARLRLGGLPVGMGVVALDERTGILSGTSVAAGRRWRVVGPGRAAWLPPGSEATVVARDGESLVLPG